MKKNYLLFVFLCILSGAHAQDWVQNSSSLYYYSGDGKKVYMEPDYSSMAVYFNDAPSTKAVQSFKSKISLFKSTTGTLPEADVISGKGVMRLKSSDGLMSIKTSDEKKSFLSTYSLDTEDAYDVLPSFTIGGSKAWMTKRVTLKLSDGVSQSDIAEVIEKYDATLVKNMLKGEMLLFEVPQIENQLPLIQELTEAGLLDWGTPDFKMDIKLFNDPLYEYQWHLNNTGDNDYSGNTNMVEGVDIDAPEAWEITTGSSDITVAVIDDGMNAHEDFPSLLTGYTPANGGDGSPDSDAYHGVPCGGLIFAQHNDIGVMGIAPDVNAFSVNIFASGTTSADIAEGIIWAVDQGADVLSNSWGYGGCYDGSLIPNVTAAFEYAATEGRDGLGCVILVASGNDFFDCVSFPANLDSVTAVGAVDGSGDRATYSNYGNDLDITAPSNDYLYDSNGDIVVIGGYYQFESYIVTTDIAGTAGSYDGEYYYAFGGTSAATPITAGVACLVLSVDPTLTKSEVEDILYDSAVDYGSNGYDTEYGHGLVNAYNAVIAAGGTVDGETDVFPDPDKTYYIDNPRWGVRLGADGSQDAFTTTTSTTGSNVEWVITPSSIDDYYFIDCVGGGSAPRIRSDQSTYADMQETSSVGSWARWSFTDVGDDTFYLSTDNESDFMRLRVNASGEVETVSASFTGDWTRFTFTEVENPSSSDLSSLEIADLKIYPNEVENVLNISFDASEKISKIEIVDLYGQTFNSENINTNEATFDVSNLTNGLYLVRLYDGDSVLESKRIIKK